MTSTDRSPALQRGAPAISARLWANRTARHDCIHPRCLAVAIPTLLVLIILSFILMKVAPGSPFSGEKAIPQTVMNNILARYGLDKPRVAAAARVHLQHHLPFRFRTVVRLSRPHA